MSEPIPPLANPDLLAAEFILGLLEDEDMLSARRRLLVDRDFAAAVDRWTERLAPLLAAVPPVVPPAALWGRIEHHLPDNDNQDWAMPAADQQQQLRRWRGGAVLGGALAAVLALALIVRTPIAPTGPGPDRIAQAAQPQLVSYLAGDSSDLKIAARWDNQAGVLHFRVRDRADGAAQPELWVIPQGGQPASLGILPNRETGALPINPALRAHMIDGATLAITLEDPATAPHAAPTSAVIASGAIERL